MVLSCSSIAEPTFQEKAYDTALKMGIVLHVKQMAGYKYVRSDVT
jgi:hypothetical protein